MITDKIYAEQLANEYSPKEKSKVKALKKLDSMAKTPSKIFGYIFGSISALIMGTGMCLSMNVIGDGSTLMMVIGIVIGVIGIVLMSINPVISKKMLEKGKEKYAGDIIELAKQISEDE